MEKKVTKKTSSTKGSRGGVKKSVKRATSKKNMAGVGDGKKKSNNKRDLVSQSEIIENRPLPAVFI